MEKGKDAAFGEIKTPWSYKIPPCPAIREARERKQCTRIPRNHCSCGDAGPAGFHWLAGVPGSGDNPFHAVLPADPQLVPSPTPAPSPLLPPAPPSPPKPGKPFLFLGATWLLQGQAGACAGCPVPGSFAPSRSVWLNVRGGNMVGVRERWERGRSLTWSVLTGRTQPRLCQMAHPGAFPSARGLPDGTSSAEPAQAALHSESRRTGAANPTVWRFKPKGRASFGEGWDGLACSSGWRAPEQPSSVSPPQLG